MSALFASVGDFLGRFSETGSAAPSATAAPSAARTLVQAPLRTGILLDNASLKIGDRQLLAGLTTELTQSRIAVIGRNGSGKSTLLRLVAGLVAPTEGTVTVNGLDPFAERQTMLSAIGLLFQNPDHQILFPTVAQELAFGLRQQGVTESDASGRVAELLRSEGRTDWLNHPTHLLSQGQRQYLCLMAILLMRPSILLLDEPFAGLDLPTRIRLERRLDRLTQQMLIVTHDPRDAGACERVLWIEGGRLVADGTPAEVLDDYVRRMTGLGALDADADLAG
jgi:biotin transport system ATP-binding protein